MAQKNSLARIPKEDLAWIIPSAGFLVLLAFIIFAVIMLRQPSASAETTQRATSATASVRVRLSCMFSATEIEPHTATIVNGQTEGEIGETKIKTLCNDTNGYALYMTGYTDETDGNNHLSNSTLGSTHDIVSTATTLDGSASDWGVKLTAISGSHTPTITDGYNNYGAVTTNYQRVAQYASASVDGDPSTDGSEVSTTYKVSIGPAQPAGTYSGKVKYILVHPQSNTDAAYGNKTFQNVNEWGGSLLVGESANVTDERDGKSYTVARLCMKTSGTCNNNDLADSMLWMTQNLDLTIGGADNDNIPIVLDSTNTNIVTDYGTANGYSTSGGVITWIPGTTVTTPATVSGTSVTGWSNSNTLPYQAEYGESVMFKGTYYDSLESCQAAGKTTMECLTYKIGNYYNWTAAVAMNNTASYTADKTVMDNSICPAGWRLPKGLTTVAGSTVQSEYNQLLNAYGLAGGTDLSGNVNVGWAGGGMAAFESTPFYFTRSGYVSGSTLNYRGSRATYWSSTVDSSSGAYYLRYNSGGLYPAGRNYRLDGFGVRCVSEF